MGSFIEKDDRYDIIADRYDLLPSVKTKIKRAQYTVPVNIDYLAVLLRISVGQKLLEIDSYTIYLSELQRFKIYINANLPFYQKRYLLTKGISQIILCGNHIINYGSSENIPEHIYNVLEHNILDLTNDILMPFNLIDELIEDEGVDNIRELAQRFQVPFNVMKARLGFTTTESV